MMRLRGRAVVLLAAMALYGSGASGAPAAPNLPEAVEDLLWDLQIAPLTGNPPPFTLPGLDGKPHSPESLKGQVVLLYFWATW